MSREEVATFAGGCFWCLEAIFKEVKGVQRVLSGYTGGMKVNPTYEEVCSDKTGHAEAVDITFFPDVISYREILEIFFTVHNPTTLNRQGNDVGTQYRSAIFYHNEAQKIIAEQVIKEINEAHIWDAPVVTELKSYQKFYNAEEYHRNYFERHPGEAYCQAIIAPEVAEFRKKWESKLKE
ncbi:MAG: peptide-methionine (S)-S-oxide reductase MsrA [Dehalococcoidales bacterium]|nr:peptide-methionine (S)-S-oxide reductase MsrA [Dehalococcoidales bacterium]